MLLRCTLLYMVVKSHIVRNISGKGLQIFQEKACNFSNVGSFNQVLMNACTNFNYVMNECNIVGIVAAAGHKVCQKHRMTCIVHVRQKKLQRLCDIRGVLISGQVMSSVHMSNTTCQRLCYTK